MTMAPRLQPRVRRGTNGTTGGMVLALPPSSDTATNYAPAAQTSGTRSPPEQQPHVRELFAVLAGWWHEATDAMSSAEQKARHRAHQRIVAMGPDAVPFILEELRDRGGHWYMALEEITGDLPIIPAGLPTNIRGEREAWLKWGKSRSLIL